MMRSVLDEYQERVLIGEIYLPISRLVKYYGENGRECDLPYNFSLVTLPWEARRIAAAIEKYESALPQGAWPNWVLGNHDVRRIASRAGAAQAGVASMLLLTLRGTPTMYFGDELGLEDVRVPADAVQDPVGKNLGAAFSRDPARTPMQWDGGPTAGFTTGKPWLPLSADHARVNVAAQAEDPRSMLSLYRRLIALRQSEPALMVGSYSALPAEGDLIAFVREHDGKRFVVVLNLGGEETSFDLPKELKLGRIVACTDVAREGMDAFEEVVMRANEGLVLETS
jgi:alpha-glucosidase